MGENCILITGEEDSGELWSSEIECAHVCSPQDIGAKRMFCARCSHFQK